MEEKRPSGVWLAVSLLLLLVGMYVAGYFLLVSDDVQGPPDCTIRCYDHHFLEVGYWPMAQVEATVTRRTVIIVCTHADGELSAPTYVRGVGR